MLCRQMRSRPGTDCVIKGFMPKPSRAGWAHVCSTSNRDPSGQRSQDIAWHNSGMQPVLRTNHWCMKCGIGYRHTLYPILYVRTTLCYLCPPPGSHGRVPAAGVSGHSAGICHVHTDSRWSGEDRPGAALSLSPHKDEGTVFETEL